MKKILFFAALSLHSALLLLLSAPLFLIGGSDVLEFVYSYPPLAKAVIVVGLFVFGYGAFFLKQYKIISRTLFAVMLLLSVLASQSLVYSGKKNAIEYTCYGVLINKILLNPSDGERVSVAPTMPGLMRLSQGGQSITYVSFICPLCLDASGMQDF